MDHRQRPCPGGDYAAPYNRAPSPTMVTPQHNNSLLHHRPPRSPQAATPYQRVASDHHHYQQARQAPLLPPPSVASSYPPTSFLQLPAITLTQYPHGRHHHEPSNASPAPPPPPPPPPHYLHPHSPRQQMPLGMTTTALPHSPPAASSAGGGPARQSGRAYVYSTQPLMPSSAKHRRLKPPMPYPMLIAKCILEAPNKRLTLRGLYAVLQKRYPDVYTLRKGFSGWQNTVRYNLSRCGVFEKVARERTSVEDRYIVGADVSYADLNCEAEQVNVPDVEGKGSWWVVADTWRAKIELEGIDCLKYLGDGRKGPDADYDEYASGPATAPSAQQSLSPLHATSSAGHLSRATSSSSSSIGVRSRSSSSTRASANPYRRPSAHSPRYEHDSSSSHSPASGASPAHMPHLMSFELGASSALQLQHHYSDPALPRLEGLSMKAQREQAYSAIYPGLPGQPTLTPLPSPVAGRDVPERSASTSSSAILQAYPSLNQWMSTTPSQDKLPERDLAMWPSSSQPRPAAQPPVPPVVDNTNRLLHMPSPLSPDQQTRTVPTSSAIHLPLSLRSKSSSHLQQQHRSTPVPPTHAMSDSFLPPSSAAGRLPQLHTPQPHATGPTLAPLCGSPPPACPRDAPMGNSVSTHASPSRHRVMSIQSLLN